MPKLHNSVHEGFLTPRKKRIWIMLGIIILGILIYSLGTIMTTPILLYLRMLILLILAWPITIFDIINPTTVPFALTILAMIVYLFYVYFLSCVVYWKWIKK